MNYDQFDNIHRRERNTIALYLGLALILSLSITTLRETTRSYQIYKSAPSIDSTLLKEDICYQGLFSIVSKNANKSLVVSKYADALESAGYSMIDFSFSRDNLRKITTSNNTCKIILSDNEILRSFQISLDQNQDHIFKYKVSNIAELILEGEDL